MVNGKEGRIFDKDFKEGITNGANDFQKDVHERIDNAQKYVYQKNDEFEGMVKDHPKAFVLGAFLGGFITGALLSRVSK